jgi:hypothetical protein
MFHIPPATSNIPVQYFNKISQHPHKLPCSSFFRDSDDDVHILALCFLASPLLPVPLFILALPHRLAAVADALLSMVHVDLLLILLIVPHPSQYL